jgi:hypothetical protein
MMHVSLRTLGGNTNSGAGGFAPAPGTFGSTTH